ncbi:MAG TPA: aminoacyl-tRNA hydrolase [Candidatus Saccharimonadales bacterium]|nr:aminoacyl-tRNA hydrolase [Candidatus Saccharimonadales bacterium]
MALFQKKPDVTSSAPLYTLGANKTILIVGLGNPGKEYLNTRHNVGFAALDYFAQKNGFPNWMVKKDLKCELALANIGESRVILCKPATFMNNSGEAASAVQHFYKIYNQSTLVVYDELAVPFGSLRTRVGGESAGHNGVKSLIEHIGDDFGRLRIGVASEFSSKADASDFVLGRFTKEEQDKLGPILQESQAIITEYIFGGQLPHETRTVV